MGNNRALVILIVVAILVVVLAAVFLVNAAGPENVPVPPGSQIDNLNGIEVRGY